MAQPARGRDGFNLRHRSALSALDVPRRPKGYAIFALYSHSRLGAAEPKGLRHCAGGTHDSECGPWSLASVARRARYIGRRQCRSNFAGGAVDAFCITASVGRSRQASAIPTKAGPRSPAYSFAHRRPGTKSGGTRMRLAHVATQAPSIVQATTEHSHTL